MIRSRIFRKPKGNIVPLRIVCLCLSLVLSFPALWLSAHGEAAGGDYDREVYYARLLSSGFPADYARPLAELKTAHPSWEFLPLQISGLETRYTFDYIIERQTEDPETNLIFPSSEYRDYWDKSSGAVYDSGWYSASDDAVRYFIDPRNFLSERDIFQFEDISYYDRDYSRGVEGVIAGTFMQSMTLENGMSFSEYVIETGERLSVSPVHIAARIRQEQGTENDSGMISGKCGELLSYFYKNGIYRTEDGILINTPSSGYTHAQLLSYNGYYNFFNMGASGTGMFQIYLNAMKRAKKGTPEMASEWGGDASWNTMYKSVYGGVHDLKSKYIDDYQNTLYLQKYNVDPRSSRNFWGQYMQNAGAALSEGREMYDSYREAGILESDFVFLIPVYSGMPGQPCADPASGNSPYSPSGRGYSFTAHSDYPVSDTRDNTENRVETSVMLGDRVRVQGYSVHTYGTEYYELSINGGEFERIQSYPRADVREKYAEAYPLSYDVNAYLGYIDTAPLGIGEHTLTVRAKTLSGSYCEVLRVSLTVEGEYGDANSDGTVDAADVEALLSYLSGGRKTVSPCSDIDRDGKINNRDLIALVKIVKEQ